MASQILTLCRVGFLAYLKFLSTLQSPGFLRSHGLKWKLTSTGLRLHTTQLKLNGEAIGKRLKSRLKDTFGLSGIKVPG